MKIKISILLLGASLMVVSCYHPADVNGDQPVTSETPLAPTPTIDQELYELGEQAFVEVVQPVFLESFPLQVHVRVAGDLPDGCTTVYRMESDREGNTFNIRIFTLREKEVLCAQALEPFEVNVPLDVYGLPAGTYQVRVYDSETEFTFSADNILKAPGAD